MRDDSTFFVNSNNNDYHLSSNNPAIDTGIDIAEVNDEFDGNPCIIGSYDVGSHEYFSGN